HSRVYYFRNNGKEEYFCSRADWMDRNFFRRTETCFPIRQRPLKERLMSDLDLFLADNCQAWRLNGDGSYQKLEPLDAEAVSAQQSLLADLAGSG
ncbi:MAG: polyphosphate kinase, partial [Woeseiaceae bacterium]